MIANIESRLADAYGRWTKRRLQEKYTAGLKGIVGEIYMTRGKRTGRMFTNYKAKGMVDAKLVEATYRDIYEVVYQAKLLLGSGRTPHKDFVLSLFPMQADLVGKRVTIKRYGCVRHPLHWLRIGHSSTEIYPQDIEED